MITSYTVLLYYKYINIKNTSLILEEQRKFCADLNLKGRILIAEEGINGTLCGREEDCKKYQEFMNQQDLFKDIHWKISYSNFICFDKLLVKIKREITILGIDPKQIPACQAAETITPEELHTILTIDPSSVILLDTRNNYESRIGNFINAIKPDIKCFRDFPTYFKKNKDLFNDKDIIMYCTGGVRCERASALLSLLKCAKRIRHLKGGICAYVEKYPDGFFRGRNYVFDDRVSIKINDTVLSSCDICSTSCDLYNNCLNALCNKHYISCDACLKKMNSCCSQECLELVENKKTITRSKLKSRELFC